MFKEKINGKYEIANFKSMDTFTSESIYTILARYNLPPEAIIEIIAAIDLVEMGSYYEGILDIITAINEENIPKKNINTYVSTLCTNQIDSMSKETEDRQRNYVAEYYKYKQSLDELNNQPLQ